MARYDSILDTIGNTPLVRLQQARAGGRQRLRQGRVLQPDGLGEGPHGARGDRARRAQRRAEARPDRDRGDERQHRHRARDGLRAEGLSAGRDDGGELQHRAPQAAALPRREGRADAGAEKGSGMLAKAVELADTHGWYLCRQFENEANADVHTRTTAQEILADFAGEPLHYFVTGLRHRRHAARRRARAEGGRAARRASIAAEPDNAQVLGSGIPQPRDADGAAAREPSAFPAAPDAGLGPDFISRLTESRGRRAAGRRDRAGRRRRGDATGARAGAAGGHLRRHVERRHARGGAAGRAPLAARHEHRLHAARHRRALSVDAALRGHRRRDGRRGARALALDAGLPLRCAAVPARAAGRRRARATRSRSIRDAAALRRRRRARRAGRPVRARVVRVLLVGAQAVRALGIAYDSVDLDSVAYQADDRGGKIRAVLAERTGSPTIPQIYIGGQHIGGCTELFDAMRDGSSCSVADASRHRLRPRRRPRPVHAAAELAAAAQDRLTPRKRRDRGEHSGHRHRAARQRALARSDRRGLPRLGLLPGRRPRHRPGAARQAVHAMRARSSRSRPTPSGASCATPTIPGATTTRS